MRFTSDTEKILLLVMDAMIGADIPSRTRIQKIRVGMERTVK